ncbi:FxLD family lanthipeptide [Sphaerimonospora cavernae]|uniref:FxLD family lanthipeptide n=1 Tax=Sphaerimonospora cavernae TaxID=1740611 RepID=A0ABV6U182_9ACTN
MAPSLTLDAPETLNVGDVTADEEFELDMRVVEATTPLVIMMCDTSDGCGNSCSTSACATSSNDPA